MSSWPPVVKSGRIKDKSIKIEKLVRCLSHQCAGRCTRTATSPPITLHNLLFRIILLMSWSLSVPVFWFAFIWSPAWAFVCAFAPSVEVELFPVVSESAWVTTTQFPSPAAVVNDTRQRFLSVPPAHLMPSGSLTPSCCVPWLVGLYGTRISTRIHNVMNSVYIITIRDHLAIFEAISRSSWIHLHRLDLS